MAVASLLVELHTEELPPKALQSLANAFATGIAKGLRERGFTGDSVVTPFGAPRRLAVHITHVAARSADKPFKQKLMPLAVAQDKAKNWSASSFLTSAANSPSSRSARPTVPTPCASRAMARPTRSTCRASRLGRV